MNNQNCCIVLDVIVHLLFLYVSRPGGSRDTECSLSKAQVYSVQYGDNIMIMCLPKAPIESCHGNANYGH